MLRSALWVTTAAAALGAGCAAVSAALVPASAHADPAAPYVWWTPGPDAVPFTAHHSEVVGIVEQPAAAALPAGAGVPVRGWVVDRFSAERPDAVRVYDGPLADLAGGKLVLEAQGYIWRREPEYLFGSSAYKASGFEGTIPDGALAPGTHSLTVAAHFQWLGWWTTTVPATISPADDAREPGASDPPDA